MFTRDWYNAKVPAEKLFDAVFYVQAEDGFYTGAFYKDDKSMEVVVTTGPMLFCTAIILS